MSYFFFDESIHSRGGFALGAFVYTRSDPSGAICDALTRARIMPRKEEFKSGAHVGRDPRQAEARERLWGVLGEQGRIALMVVPFDSREALGHEALVALRGFLGVNNLVADLHQVFLDQGLFPSRQSAFESVGKVGLPSTCTLHPESDSRTVLGLQLADLVAHSASVILLEQQGIISKMVKAGPEAGYDSDLDVELGFELWAGLRWRFFGGDPPHPETWKSQLDLQVPVEPFGLYVSPGCSPALGEQARKCFGSMYLGCIH